MKLANNDGKMALLLDQEETKTLAQMLKNADLEVKDFAKMVKKVDLSDQLEKNKLLLTKALKIKKEELINE